jgi:hypothetical protein
MSAIETNDAPVELTEDDAADVFLKRFMPPDAEKPSGTEGTKDDEVETETDDEKAEKPIKSDDEEESETDDEDKSKRKYADDDATYVKIKVDGEDHEVRVKDLSRLFGQEASLTKKSMEVAEQRKVADAENTKAVATLGVLLERAKQAYEPYSKIDFLLAAKDLSTEDYTALRQAAEKAHADVQFLGQNLDGFMTGIKTKQQNDLVTQARESIKVLSGPVDKGGIEGWSEKVYDEIRAFAIKEGAPQDIVNQLTDPWAVRLLHDAMLYQRGKSRVITTKVNKTPKKVTKTTTSPAVSGKSGGDKTGKAMKELQRSGSTDAAADAFLARWEQASAD